MSALLDKKIGNKIKAQVIKILEKNRPDWNIPHTLDAVKWMRLLINTEGGSERILIPVMYLHDIGYPIMKKGYNYEEMMASKPGHSEIAAEKARPILKNLNFKQDEIDRIAHLVETHAKHDLIKKHNEQLVFEADSLAQINYNEVPPSFNKDDTIKFLEYFKRQRVPRVKTKTGVKLIKKILKEAEDYINNWK